MTTRHDELSLGEGGTPVLGLPALARRLGVPPLWAKAEWLNPTGSYKDRIALATVRDAIARDAKGWIGTSSGNAGAAMSAYGARAGLAGFLCVAADAPVEKLRSIAPYGVELFRVSGLGLGAMEEISELAIAYDLKLAVTAYRYNVEGMRGAEAIGVELGEQGSFTHVYVPTGGGGLLTAVARGSRRSSNDDPVIVCAQPGGCGPIVRCLDGEITVPEIDACDSDISGLQLPVPPDGELAVDAVRQSGGWGCLVPDAEAFEMRADLARQEGVFVEPASALAVAAIVRDFRSGRLTADDRPIAILTGTGLKDLRRIDTAVGDGEAPSTLADLRAALAASMGAPRAISPGRTGLERGAR